MEQRQIEALQEGMIQAEEDIEFLQETAIPLAVMDASFGTTSHGIATALLMAESVSD